MSVNLTKLNKTHQWICNDIKAYYGGKNLDDTRLSDWEAFDAWLKYNGIYNMSSQIMTALDAIRKSK